MSTFPRVRSVGCERNHTRGTTRTRNFCKFCKTFVPVPETSLSSVRPWHNARGTGMPFYEIPGGGGGYGYCTTFVYLPGTFCEFCKTSIPVPGTSVSSVGLSFVPVLGTWVSETVVFCRVRTEPYPGYCPYPELLQVSYV